MRKQLSRLVLLGALLSPSALYALGLGELKLNSALNQPFDAEIELIAPTSEELAELKVALANNEAFSRYGLDRPAFLSNFEFSVTRNRDGRSAIKVTSSSSVTEPFVTLLVEVVSGRGRLLREYTVLLDPPVELPNQPENPTPVTTTVSGSTSDAIERPSVTPAEPESAPEPVAQLPIEPAAPEPVAEQAPAAVQPQEQVAFTPTPSPAPVEEPIPSPSQSLEPVPAPQQAPAPSGGSYTVQRNDTLSQIVRDVVRPGVKARSEINKTMIAMFRANPAAFSNNINRLRAGAVLRLPDISEIEAITASEAGAEVARQRELWAGPAQMEALSGTRTDDQLRLVTPKDAPSTPVGTIKANNDRRGSSSGLGTNPDDNRLALQNEALALQQRNAQQPAEPAAPQPAAPPPPTNTLQEQAVETEAVPPDTPPPAQGEPVPLPTANQPSMFDRVTDFWWVPLVAGMLLGLVGFVVFLVRRRNREPDLGDALDAPPLTFEPRIANDLQQNNRKRSRGEAFAVPNDPLPDEEEAPAFSERDRPTVFREEPVARAIPEPAPAPAPKPKVVPPAAPAPAPRSMEDTMSSETAVRFDQQDALAEADFHMAYGLYDQAADLVKIAIDREPNRRELKLKLLEIYFVWGNRELFLETARELHRSRDRAAPGEWENILIMGRQIAPEEAMFKADAGARVDLVDVNLEGGENRVDVDLFAAPESSRESLDLEFASGERAGPDSDIDYLLDETRSRDYDPAARTQETPTIESPVLESTGQTSRMRSLNGRKGQAAARNGAAAYEDATAMRAGALRDDERTQLAPSLGSLDRTMLAPRSDDNAIYIDQVDLTPAAGDTVEQRRPARANTADSFSDEIFNGGTNRFERIDLDVGDSLATEDRTATMARQTRGGGAELTELEPVTMSEVGTKLDLARAYMDMGDPDGARSILEEVVEEGNVSQKQEAQRLLESVR